MNKTNGNKQENSKCNMTSPVCPMKLLKHLILPSVRHLISDHYDINKDPKDIGLVKNGKFSCD